MTATFYFHVGDGELRAEDANPNVRIIAGNFDWTILLENRLDCARWMKAIADADALFIKRKTAAEAHDVIVPPVRASVMTPEQKSAWEREVPDGCPCDYIWTGLVWTRSGSTPACDIHSDELPDLGIDEPGLEPLPPLPQRTPAGPPAAPWQAAMDAELSPEALAGETPLTSLAAGDDTQPEENEAQA